METMAFAPVPAAGVQSAGMAQVVKRSFNRGFFDRSDPFDGAGILFRGATSATSYRVEHGKHATVLNQLFGTVYARLRASSIPDVSVKLVDYDDAWIESEPARRYVEVEKETPRGTHMQFSVNFRSYGDYVYVAIDAYVLPSLHLFRMLREWARVAYVVFVVFVVGSAVAGALGMIASGISMMSSFGLGGAAGFTVAGFGVKTLLWMWITGFLLYRFRDVLRSLSAGDTLPMALRREYHHQLHDKTFDIDDVLAFYKSTALLAIDAIAEVFEANGISTDVLTQVRQTINLSTNVINNGGSMNVFGSVEGAAGNSVMAGVTAAFKP